MAADRPPWVVGTNCNVTLQHAGVNGEVESRFYVKPDSYGVVLPKVWYPGQAVQVLDGVLEQERRWHLGRRSRRRARSALCWPSASSR